MKKSIISALCLFFIATAPSFAQKTAILSPGINAVQCNHWGWVEGNSQTVWEGGCTPLEARSKKGEIHSVATTVGKCDDNEVAVYFYPHSENEILFAGCYA